MFARVLIGAMRWASGSLSRFRAGISLLSLLQIGQPARERTRRLCRGLDFAMQCRQCERESINVSLGNLLTYPW